MRCFFVAACYSLIGVVVCRAGEPELINITKQGKVIRPLEDSGGLYTWLTETKREDPKRAYVVSDGELHVSGEGAGYLATKNEYCDYRLSLEYQWGKRTDGSKFVRNSGLLLHGSGPDGASHGVWMSSIEVQLAQGCEGDLIVIRPDKPEKGEPLATLWAEVAAGADGNPRWKPGGEKKQFTNRQLWWSKHQAGFEELLDTRGKDDVASPLGEWTKVECICDGNRLRVKINGEVINEAFDITPTAGRILLQNESNEITFRKFELHPLKDEERLK